MLEFMSFLTKQYPNFHEVASYKTMNNILEQFDTIFNEENKIKVLNKKQSLLNKGYEELFIKLKEDADFIDKFYDNPISLKTYYLDIQTNEYDKEFIIHKKCKK
jgi:trans-aconitate methyltransferase